MHNYLIRKFGQSLILESSNHTPYKNTWPPLYIEASELRTHTSKHHPCVLQQLCAVPAALWLQFLSDWWKMPIFHNCRHGLKYSISWIQDSWPLYISWIRKIFQVSILSILSQVHNSGENSRSQLRIHLRTSFSSHIPIEVTKRVKT